MVSRPSRLPGTAVRLTQKDIRAVQLAKSAICAGMRTLIAEAGLQAEAIAELVVAGGFGSRIDPVSAERIGLFPARLRRQGAGRGQCGGAGAAMCCSAIPSAGRRKGCPPPCGQWSCPLTPASWTPISTACISPEPAGRYQYTQPAGRTIEKCFGFLEYICLVAYRLQPAAVVPGRLARSWL